MWPELGRTSLHHRCRTGEPSNVSSVRLGHHRRICLLSDLGDGRHRRCPYRIDPTTVAALDDAFCEIGTVALEAAQLACGATIIVIKGSNATFAPPPIWRLPSTAAAAVPLEKSHVADRGDICRNAIAAAVEIAKIFLMVRDICRTFCPGTSSQIWNEDQSWTRAWCSWFGRFCTCDKLFLNAASTPLNASHRQSRRCAAV